MSYLYGKMSIYLQHQKTDTGTCLHTVGEQAVITFDALNTIYINSEVDVIMANNCKDAIEVPGRNPESLTPISSGEEKCAPGHSWGPGFLPVCIVTGWAKESGERFL